MPQQWKELITALIRRVVYVLIIDACYCYQLHTKLYPTFFTLGKIHVQTKLLWIISMNFDIADQLSIMALCSSNGHT